MWKASSSAYFLFFQCFISIKEVTYFLNLGLKYLHFSFSILSSIAHFLLLTYRCQSLDNLFFVRIQFTMNTSLFSVVPWILHPLQLFWNKLSLGFAFHYPDEGRYQYWSNVPGFVRLFSLLFENLEALRGSFWQQVRRLWVFGLILFRPFFPHKEKSFLVIEYLQNSISRISKNSKKD